MDKTYSRPLAVLVLFLIIIYGILKIWVLRVYAAVLDWCAEMVGLQNNSVFQIVREQAKQEDVVEQTLGWLIYYPTYFLLHIAFIYLLFANNLKVRNYLMLGLTALITVIVILWVGFLAIKQPDIADFFRKQFRNLFGLPFILLIIEGGRILYQDLERLVKRDF